MGHSVPGHASSRMRGRMSERRELQYEGIHCTLRIEQPTEGVVVLRIKGSDIGEFGEAPMQALDTWLAGAEPIDFFVDAREVRGATVDVSSESARWLVRNRPKLRSVT